MQHLFNSIVLNLCFNGKLIWSNSFGCQILHRNSVTCYGGIIPTCPNWTNYALSKQDPKNIWATILAWNHLPWLQCFGTIPSNLNTNTNIFCLGNLISNFLQVFLLLDFVWCYKIFVSYWQVSFSICHWKINPNWFSDGF